MKPILLGLALAANAFHQVDPSALPSAPIDGDLGLLKTAITRQLEACRGQDLSAQRSFGSRTVTRQLWCVDTGREMLKLISQSSSFPELLKKARAQFEWYKSVGSDGAGKVTFTGYNAPTLNGSLKKTPTFRFPIYSRPADLVEVPQNGKSAWRRKTSNGELVPYYERQEIDQQGALEDRGLEIAYVDDFFSVTLLQIEGSGSVILNGSDGSRKTLRVNYNSQNGFPVTTPRKVLQSQGVPEEFLTIPGMRRYFRLHPNELEAVLMKNRSYIFFDPSGQAPQGVDGLQLTALHSLAVDLSVFPVGAVTLFQAQKPIPNSTGDDSAGFEPFTRFGLTQDTGGSIVGPGRVDIYWGEDRYAELASGTTNHPGELFIALLP